MCDNVSDLSPQWKKQRQCRIMGGKTEPRGVCAGVGGGLVEGKRKGKCCNYTILSKVSKIIKIYKKKNLLKIELELIFL